jgi:hypothetical protein
MVKIHRDQEADFPQPKRRNRNMPQDARVLNRFGGSPLKGPAGETACPTWLLSTPFQKYANVSGNRLLTRAAQIRAATVTERLPRNTTPYL